MKCTLCQREAQTKRQSQYCERHQKAYDNIQNKFENWKTSLNIEWKDYLEEIAKNPFTGTWTRDIADSLLSELRLEQASAKRNV